MLLVIFNVIYGSILAQPNDFTKSESVAKAFWRLAHPVTYYATGLFPLITEGLSECMQ